MAKYLLVYHGGKMPETPEAQKKIMDAWMAWFGGMGASVVDGGNPIGQTRTIGAGGQVSDGGGANPASGYSVIEADSMDAAVQKAKGCPVLLEGGTVEVGETFNAM